MSARTEAVETYFEGFRTGDHAKILARLTDDVVWDLPGFKHLEGKEAFDGEIENPDFVGQPQLVIERLFEDVAAGVVVALGEGRGEHRQAGRFRFAFNDVFTFDGDLIARVESYLAQLGAPEDEG